MEEIWGWLIVIYLFMGGLGAGAFLTSFAAGRGWIGNSPALQRIGYFISGPIVALGTILLVFDLGQGLKKPWLLIGLLANPRSVMTWGVYILACFIVVALVVGFLTWKKKVVPKGFIYAGAFLALATGTYTGLLVAVITAVPFWNTYLMPVLFVVSALSTGMSITSILSYVLEKGQKTDERRICKIHIGLVGAEVVLLLAIFATMLSGRHGAVGIESAKMILAGSLALPFWILLVGVGLVIPLAVFMMNYKKLSKFKVKVPVKFEVATASSQAEHSGAHVEEIDCSRSLLTVDTGVIIGGFILRFVVIFAALPLWNGVLK
ncbi:NrfD/PsrC family molybdoenzyme membrane anchor subunit [Desulfitobacterium metallireducens]|uniref:Oxidoreductase n=1 Tax=Desulfitobacterium metallireducens DSM 15288 TaxID=871968 RepID=W0EDS7_9FIRM|nr:NrfD/PsrC family molybdoenzyme membrane anchor subunit [Desulfitobacterium metallireducens]AHF07211.1 oxidoreductase [Desulfitobacterium metallireducens DSM 15288]